MTKLEKWNAKHNTNFETKAEKELKEIARLSSAWQEKTKNLHRSVSARILILIQGEQERFPGFGYTEKQRLVRALELLEEL